MEYGEPQFFEVVALTLLEVTFFDLAPKVRLNLGLLVLTQLSIINVRCNSLNNDKSAK